MRCIIVDLARPRGYQKRDERGCSVNCAMRRPVPSDRWQQVSQIYHEALSSDEGERAAYLRVVCAGDEELQREVVAALIQQPVTADGFLAAPAVAVAAQMIHHPAGSMLMVERLASTRSCPSLVREGWARCIARATRNWAAM
jgi:hypothetical protein